MWPHAAFALRVCALLIIHVCVAKTQILTPQLLLNSTACTQSQLEVPALACGFSANISLKAGSLPAQLPANTRWTSAVQQLEATLGCNGSSALQGPAGCGTDPSTLAAAVPASLDLRSLSGLFSVPPNGTLEIRGLSIVGAALPSAPFPLPASGFLALSAFRLGAGARLRLVDSFLTVPSCALLSLHQTYACGVSPSPNVTVTPSSLVVHRLTTPSLDATNVTVQCSGAAAPFPCLAASVRSGTELLAAVRSAQESSDAATAAFGKFTATLYLQLSGHILLAESVARDCPDWSTRVRIRYFKASADLFVPLLEPCPIITNMAIVLQGTEDGSTVLDLAGSTSLFSLESRAVGFSGSVELRWLRLRNPPAGPLGTLPYSLMRLPLWTFEFRRRVVGVELPAYLRVSDCVLELPPEEIAMWRYRSSLPLVPELQQHTCLVDDSFYMLEAKLPSEQPHPKDIVLTYGSGWSGSFFYQRLLLQTVVRDGIATVPAAAVTAVVPGAFPGGLPPQQHQDQQALGGGTIAAASAAAAAAAGTLLSSWPFLSAAKRAQLLAATAYIWEPSMCLLIAPGSPMGIAASQVRSVIAAAIQAADVDSMSGGVEQRAQQVACFQQANSTQNSTAVAPPAGGTNSTNSVAFSISSADSSARLPAGCMLSQDVRVLALSVDAYLDFRINIVDALAPKYNPQRRVAMYAPAMLMGEPLGARVLDLAGLMAAVRLSGPGAACMTLRHLVLIGAPPASAPPAVWVASPRPKAAPPPSAPGPPPPSPPLASSTPAATLPAGVSLAGPATQTADHRRRRRRRLGSNRRLAQQASVAATSPPPPHQAAGVLAGMTQGLAPALTNFTSCLWTFEFSRSPEALAADLAGGAGGRPAGLPRLFLDSVVLVVPEAELQLLGRVWAASADMLSGRLAFSADTDPGLAAALRAMLEGSQLGGGSGSGSSANQGTVSLWFPVLSWCGYVGLNVTLTSALPAAAADEYGQSTAAGTLIPPVMQLPWVRMAAPSPATPPGQAIGDDPSAGGVPTAGNVRLPAGPLGFEPGASPRGDPPPATRQLPHSAATATSQSPAHGLASPPESSPGVLISSDQGSTSTSNGTGGSNASGSGIPFMRSVLVPCLVSGVVVGLAAAAVTWECRRRRRRDQQALPQKQLGPDKGVQIESSRNACDGGQLPNSSLEAPSGSDVVHAAATFPTSGSGRSGGGGVAVLLAVAPSGNPRSSKRHKLWKPDIHSSGNATPNSSPRASSQSSGGLRRAMLNMLHALEHSRQQLSHASQAPIGTGETKGPAAGLSAATGGTAASTDGFVPTRPGTDKYGSSHQTQQHEHESLPLGCPEPPPVLAITGELGRGAQGVVYRGVWRGLDVAVKSVLFHLEPGPGGAARDVPVQRAVQEAAIAVSMAHPNIVATYTYQLQPLQAQAPNAHSEQWVRTGNDSYLGTTVDCTGSGSGSSATPGHAAEAEVWKLTLIQELCDANSLRHCLQSGLLLLGRQAGAGAGVGTGSDAGQSTALQPPPARTMLLLACDIARGLAHLHERGVVHADLSSNNVLLQSTAGRPPRMSAPGATGGGPPAPNSSAVDTGLCVVAKLCDFGLSGRLDVEADATHLSGPARRSSAYSAPELVAHGRSGPAGDVYAFAVVLWELALGLPLPVALVRPESAGLRAWQSEQARLLPLGDDDLNASGTGGQASDVALASLALPPGLLWWPPGTPAGLVSLVAECLRPEPRSRPPAAAVLQRLQARLLSPQGVGEERQGSRHWKGILGIMTALLGFE